MLVFIIKVSVLLTLENFHLSNGHGKLFAVLLLDSTLFSVVVTLASQSHGMT